MIFFGSGTVGLIIMATFSFFNVNMGIEGQVGGWICAAFAVAAFVCFCQRSVQFVKHGNILGWLI